MLESMPEREMCVKRILTETDACLVAASFQREAELRGGLGMLAEAPLPTTIIS